MDGRLDMKVAVFWETSVGFPNICGFAIFLHIMSINVEAKVMSIWMSKIGQNSTAINLGRSNVRSNVELYKSFLEWP